MGPGATDFSSFCGLFHVCTAHAAACHRSCYAYHAVLRHSVSNPGGVAQPSDQLTITLFEIKFSSKDSDLHA